MAGDRRNYFAKILKIAQKNTENCAYYFVDSISIDGKMTRIEEKEGQWIVYITVEDLPFTTRSPHRHPMCQYVKRQQPDSLTY